MASYESLTFQPSLFREKIISMCDDALNDAVGVIMRNEYFANGVKTALAEYEGMDGYIEVTASDLKAWIVEYGQGEAADTERNPYWDSYVKSGYTSPSRTNGTVLRRGAGTYESIDFEHNKIRQHTSGSEPSGEPLSSKEQKALSREPHPFLENLFEEAYDQFVISLESRLSTFDISSCFYKSINNI